MANPNIVNVSDIRGNTAYVTPASASILTFNWTHNGTTALPMLTPAVNTVNRITGITVSNLTSSAATATVLTGAGAVFSGSISTTTLTNSAPTQGAIAIGMTLYTTGANFVAGTTITAGSGTSWTVSSSQTVTSSTF